MFDGLNRMLLAAVLFLAGAGLLVAPTLLAVDYPAPADTSSAIIGIVMMLSAIGIGYGSLDFWSRLTLGVGAWSLVAPVPLGFYDGNAGFWSHMAAGFASLLVGVAGHELMGRRQAVQSAA